jgi:hypothetical protein
MFYKVSDLSLWFGRSLVVPFVAVAVTEQPAWSSQSSSCVKAEI